MRGWFGRGVLGVMLVACGGEVETASAPRAYTGQLGTTDAEIALVEQGGQVRAYVCGGAATYTSLSRWFTLTRSPGAPGESAVSGVADGWSLEGTITPGGAQGTLRGPAGEATLSWQAQVVHDEASGLYELRNDEGIFGAIVQQSAGSDEPAVQGTLLGRQGYRAQVTPVRPVVMPGDLRVAVTVDAVMQVRTLRRVPAAP